MAGKRDKMIEQGKKRRNEMSTLRNEKGLSYQDIGKIYGISRQRVWGIINRKDTDKKEENAIL